MECHSDGYDVSVVICSQRRFLRFLWGISLFDSQEKNSPKSIAIGKLKIISIGVPNNRSGNWIIILDMKYLTVNVVNCMMIVKTSAEITRSKASGFRWGVREWKIAAVKNPGRRKTST